jgi:hypothetical protein
MAAVDGLPEQHGIRKHGSSLLLALALQNVPTKRTRAARWGKKSSAHVIIALLKHTRCLAKKSMLHTTRGIKVAGKEMDFPLPNRTALVLCGTTALLLIAWGNAQSLTSRA